jgi:hypothetical protein
MPGTFKRRSGAEKPTSANSRSFTSSIDGARGRMGSCVQSIFGMHGNGLQGFGLPPPDRGMVSVVGVSDVDAWVQVKAECFGRPSRRGAGGRGFGRVDQAVRFAR